MRDVASRTFLFEYRENASGKIDNGKAFSIDTRHRKLIILRVARLETTYHYSGSKPLWPPSSNHSLQQALGSKPSICNYSFFHGDPSRNNNPSTTTLHLNSTLLPSDNGAFHQSHPQHQALCHRTQSILVRKRTQSVFGSHLDQRELAQVSLSLFVRRILQLCQHGLRCNEGHER